jgi:integrase
LSYKKWSIMWADWRKAAGWPGDGTFHDLRHFFATTLLANGVDPAELQRALRHATLRRTLDTYVRRVP